MKFKSRVSLSLLSLLLYASLAMAADTQLGSVAPGAAPAPVNSGVKPAAETTSGNSAAPSPAVAEAPAPKPDTVTIRLNAPLLSPKFSSTPLAVVNDDIITFEDLKSAIGMIHSGMGTEQAAPKKNFADVLKRLVNVRLMVQEARNIGLDKDEQIKPAMDEFKKQLLRDTLLNEQVKDIAADEKDVARIARERSMEWRLKSLVVGQLSTVKAFEAEIKAGNPFDKVYDSFVSDGRGKKGGNVEEFIARDAIDPTMLVALEKLKVGDTGKPVAIEKGYVIYRVEEIRTKDDPKMVEQVRQELTSQRRVAALKKFNDSLVKKYVKMKKLYKTLDYENKKIPFEKLLKDNRVIAEIQGEKPLTVADFSDAVSAKFFHGVKRAIESKKVNKEKDAILEEILSGIVIDKEARLRRIDQTEEYHNKVKSKEDTLLFGQFMQKVVVPEVTITRDETKAYYTEHAKDFISPASYLLDAIAFYSPEKAEEAVNKLRTGTDFKWYKANAEGQDSISTRYEAFFEGNPVALDELPAKMKQALSGSAKGDYRPFVDGTIGYVLAVVDYQAPAPLPYETVEGVIREKVSYMKLNDNIESWSTKLRKASEVTVYADFTQQEKP
ncbi:peptidylprolyl isomerase [Geomonas agri]|uniref:peptidylprolyl isomerase n=1 Tax=Geomonas agri TaxID=2873702 RepID=UPI001CD7453F|nr:peptidyl-prolyl cis-trans isomerase [Geomonas agri]